jgi:hypothetical protein
MAALALAGVLMPALIKAIHIDSAIENYARAASTLKNLQGDFRRAAKVWSKKSHTEFEAEARKVIKALNDARKPSLTPPEWCFRLAQAKIKRGDYTKDNAEGA